MSKHSLYLVVGVATVVVIVVCLWFRHYVKKGQGVVPKACRKIAWEVGKFVRVIRSYLYIFWWGFSLPARRIIVGSTFLVVTAASVWFAIGFALALFHERFFGQNVPLLVRWAVIVLEALLTWHHIRGWIHQKERWAFASVLRLLLRELSLLPSGATDAQKEESVGKIMQSLHSVFQPGIKGLTINIMVLGKDDRLRIPNSYWYPRSASSVYPAGFFLAAGQGGAGAALEKGFIVYMPAIKYRHGISIWLPGTKRPPGLIAEKREYDLLDDVYVSCDPEPYKCILSIPASMTSSKAVLNLNSDERDAFAERHFDMLDIGASLVGMVLDK